jgi:hypothetical protein
MDAAEKFAESIGGIMKKMRDEITTLFQEIEDGYITAAEAEQQYFGKDTS